MLCKFIYYFTYNYFWVCQFIKISKDVLIGIAIYLVYDDPKKVNRERKDFELKNG